MEKNTRRNFWIAVTYAVVLFVGILLGQNYVDENRQSSRTALIPLGISDRSDKVRQTLDIIGNNYVDSVNLDSLQQLVLTELVGHLDPYSEYLSPREARARQQKLEGSFDGIGVEYFMLSDTVLAVGLIHDGPAERAGLKVGDRILAINDHTIAGVQATERELEEQMRGKRGSVIALNVLRQGFELPFPLKVTRDKVEISTIDAAYMITPTTAYVKIKAFGGDTIDDFTAAMQRLQKNGVAALILDLRGNRGGYFAGAIELASQFLEADLPIVYTEGKNAERKGYFVHGEGLFRSGDLLILIDENTASSSEIVAAAIQDHGRGLLVGSPSYGKGMVQARFAFGDGAALNLTVARYVTPNGRSIQRPAFYDVSIPEAHGSALIVENQYHKPRAGGIIPDVLMEPDSLKQTDFYQSLHASGLIQEYVYTRLTTGAPSFSIENYLRGYFLLSEEFSEFLDFLHQEGYTIVDEIANTFERLLSAEIEALLGRYYFGNEAYFKVRNRRDPVVTKGLEMMSQPTDSASVAIPG